MKHVLISGTRHATAVLHRPTIADGIKAAFGGRWCDAVLIHGDAPGVDTIAAELAESWGWQVKAMPADWPTCDLTVPQELGGCPDWPHRKRRRDGSTYCPYAGRRRNQTMVDLVPRADHVLVFPAAGPVARSRGTWDLYRRAVRAGLNVHDPIPLEVG